MRRVAGAIAAGVLYGLALPPWGCSWFGWVALAPLIAVTRGGPTRAGLWLGTLGGYVAGWVTQWWFAETVRHYFQASTPTAVLATIAAVLLVWGIPFGLFAAAAARITSSARRPLRPPLLAAAWTATEFGRAWLTGQPWGLLGYSQHEVLPVIQVAAWTGVYGISFLLALSAAALVEGGAALRSGSWRDGARVVAWLLLVPAAWLGGLVVLGEPPAAGTTTVVVVQANVRPERHWTRAYAERQIRAHAALTRAAAKRGPVQLIVWPENAIPRYPENDALLMARLRTIVRGAGTDILFGAPRSAGGHVYNSLRLLRRDGTLRHYDKHVLVPFAEAPLAAGGDPTTADSPESFTAGEGPAVLAGPVPLGVSICHEVLHPELLRQSVRDGAGILVNIANDGLADQGYSVAAAQHAAMAALRAVEMRRPLLRAAATGPSLVVDPHGRVLAALPQGVAGAITARVAAAQGLTPYVRVGDVFALACLACTLLAVLPLPVRQRRTRPVLLPSAS